jgi:hypothetical protein
MNEVTYPWNPAHPVGTCAKCGAEMAYNVPRTGPNGGYVHKETGKPICRENQMNKPTEAHRATLNEFERKSSDRCHLNHEDQTLFLQLIADSEVLAVEVQAKIWGLERDRLQEATRELRESVSYQRVELIEAQVFLESANKDRHQLRADLAKLKAAADLNDAELGQARSDLAAANLPIMELALAQMRLDREKAERERDELRAVLERIEITSMSFGAGSDRLLACLDIARAALAKSAPLPPCRDNIPPEMHERHVAESGDRRGTP